MNWNSYWYLGLCSSCLLILTAAFITRRNVHTLLHFLVMVEIAYLIEAVIYIFLGSYEYRPGLIMSNEFYDSHMGAITSNLITVPTLGLLIGLFQLGWGWIILLIGVLAFVEWLFVREGIYTLYWWRIEYTSLGLLFYFPASRLIHRHLVKPVKGLAHTLFLFLSIGPLSGTLHFLPFMLFSCRMYRPGWYEDAAHDTSAFGIIYYLSIVLFITILAEIRSMPRWMKYVSLELVLMGVTILLAKAHILYSLVWWDPWIYLSFPLGVLWIAETFSSRLTCGQLEIKLRTANTKLQ